MLVAISLEFVLYIVDPLYKYSFGGVVLSYFSMRSANGLLCLPAGDRVLPKGCLVEALLIAPLITVEVAQEQGFIPFSSETKHGCCAGCHGHAQSHDGHHLASHESRRIEIKTAVLTVSDRCSRGEQEDKSGPAIIEVFAFLPLVPLLRPHY